MGELAQQPQTGCSSSARSCVEPSPSCADLRLNQGECAHGARLKLKSRRPPKFLVAPVRDPPARRARTATGTPQRIEGRSVRDRTCEAAGRRSRCLDPDRQPLNTGWSALASSFASRVDVVALGLASPPSRGLPLMTRNPRLAGVSLERMKGLEPSTFCMARTVREVPGGARRGQSAFQSHLLRARNDTR